MAKKIVYYLKSTIYLGLIYIGHLKDKKETKALITPFFFEFIRYKKNSYAKEPENQKFVIKYYDFINKIVVF